MLTRLSHNAGQFLQLSYNGAHIETITDHTGTLSVSFTYNAEQLASVTDIFGRSTHYTYFGSGASKQALQTVQYPDNTHEDFSYDSAGTVTVTSNGSVQTFFYGDYGYDEKGNLESITYPDSTKEHYLYDTKWNITQSTNRRGTPITYNYDANGLVLLIIRKYEIFRSGNEL